MTEQRTATTPSGDDVVSATCGTCHPPEEDTPEREAMDRFATFLRIVGDAPRDDEGHYLVNPRALEYAKGGDVDPFGCTGVTARWCPRHGDCTCPHPEDEPGNDEAWHMASPGCPLHDPAGDHPWPDDAELLRDSGHAETPAEPDENG